MSRSIPRREVNRTSKLVAALTVLIGLSTMSAGVAAARMDPPDDAGNVVLVDPEKTTKELTSGDTNTEFTFVIPDGASCPGDSAHDDWRVDTFIIPAAEPVPVQFAAIGPKNPD